MGDWLGSLSYASVEGDNGMAWSFGTLPPGTAFNDRWGGWIGIPNYGFIMRSYDVRTTEYDAVYLTLDRPYTRDAKWGLNFVYTYAEAWQNASLDEGTAFAFDYLPPDWPMFPGNADERHRFVASGTVGLPVNFQLSSIITLGSGVPWSPTPTALPGGTSASGIPTAAGRRSRASSASTSLPTARWTCACSGTRRWAATRTSP